ncbi:restriction endonuclease subunit S [Aeromonas veronii]|uniref:restriction endonuclease subunit S n=1 Tax=Aeromonas veronii TaxID=654 RepID=UPI00330AEF27|nr:restriction endonuclease subunit S [Aeromonas veronii]
MKAGWYKKKLGEVCELVNGRAYRKPELLSEGKYKVLRVGNFFTNEHWYYSDLELEDKKFCDDGDLLYAWSASFGPQVWTGEKVIFHYHIWKVIPDFSQIDKQFLFYFLEWDKELLKLEKGAGTTMIHVSKGSMEEREILVPPLTEQQRIVAILDEAFEAIATARANAEQNRQNARTLFESYLQSVFSQKGGSRHETTLGRVCTFIGGSQPPKAVFEKEPTTENIRLIQIRDYKSDRNTVYIPRTMAKRFCDAEDVMIGRYGPPLFQILRGLEGAYNVALIKAVPDESRLSRDYLFYFLKHSDILQYVIYHSERAAGQIGVTKETLEPYPIAIPTQLEQERIVKIVSKLEYETQRLESLYQRKIAALDELKQSLLQQAFSGQLTAQQEETRL